MNDTTYTYKINTIKMKDTTSFTPGRINVFVGANNCGKTQLLKDMLEFITGTRVTRVVLDELDITYPKSWEQMQQAYCMEIIDAQQPPRLRHIAPTLDRDPVTYTNSNVSDTLEGLIRRDNKQQFRSATGAGMVSYLNTDNRLSLAKRQPVQQNLDTRGPKNLLEAVYTAGSEATKVVCQCVQKIFNTEIFLNPYNPGVLEFKESSDFSDIPSNPQDAFRKLKEEKYHLLDTQGDGLRSVVGIITAIVSVNKPIILLDEPEAFLHPPQAIQLGEMISNLIQPSQQIFIATHSADFLRGLLGSTEDAVIIRLNRVADRTTANVMDADTLSKMATDPLLSSSRVLEGMFYKGVVATEGDADSAFYQRLFQKVGAADEVHFVNAHNKQTLRKIIEPYSKLGIKFAMIADADVIRDEREFKDLLQVSSDNDLKDCILEDRKAILNYFQQKDRREVLDAIREQMKELIDYANADQDDSPEEIENRIRGVRAKLKNIRNESDELCAFKKYGRSSLPSELQAMFDCFWNNCAGIGLFIVYVGELESWLVDYGVERTSNKSRWIEQALNKLFDIKYDETKDVWRFIDQLRKYLTGYFSRGGE